MTAHADRIDGPDAALGALAPPGAWLDAIPDLAARLEAATRPRIADVGCGLGGGTLGVARAVPHAWVDGFDTDPDAIEDARRRAAEAGLDGRVRFLLGDARRLVAEGVYDLVLVLGATPTAPELRAVRSAVRRGASVLLADGAGLATVAARSGFTDAQRILTGRLCRLRG